MEVLEHLKNPFYLMAQVYDLLDEKGVCYIAVPYTKIALGGSIRDKFSAGEWDNGHVSRWKKKELIKDMKRIGFKVRVIQQRRRFKGFAFWLPHCWLVLALKK